MMSTLTKRVCLIIFCVTMSAFEVPAQKTFEEKHMEVSLRMIGHRVLLNAADSVSRVLPIIEKNGQYRIEFESEFGFQPDDLVRAVSEIMEENETAIRYIVEVEECSTEQVVYSFEIDNHDYKDIIPCLPRGQSKECFSLIFTILEKQPIQESEPNPGETSRSIADLAIPLSIGLIVLFGVGLVIFYNKKKSPDADNLIKLGKYRFDQRNALLILEEQKTELTSKEADLLELLYSSANTTVKREEILHAIWEDEGSYVGRTLDVFISKLRAKLQADPTIKIVNNRGVGYKLVVND